MVNNFDQIKSLLKFDSPDEFYFLQIFQRRKDNPDLKEPMRVIGDYYIYSIEQFEKMENHIIEMCTAKNARAYIRLNRRDAKKIGLQMLKRISEMLIQENYRSIKNAYPSVVGEFHSDKDKSWLIDIDYKDFEGKTYQLSMIHEELETLQRQTGREPRMDKIPTKNGYHLITRPFNVNLFRKNWPQIIDVHKDNPTILFIP